MLLSPRVPHLSQLSPAVLAGAGEGRPAGRSSQGTGGADPAIDFPGIAFARKERPAGFPHPAGGALPMRTGCAA